MSNNRALFWAIVLAIAVRAVVFAGTMFWPIPNENLLLVSPLHPPGYQDFEFYLSAWERYRAASIWEIVNEFVAFYQRPLESQFGHIIAGPIFPGLVALFDYGKESTLPLATFFLLMSSTTAVIWLYWMAQFKMSAIWFFLFAVAPNPVWFMLVLSPDALFAFFVCVFFVCYFQHRWSRAAVVIWVSVVFLALLTRPNGYSILLFVLIDLIMGRILYGRHHILGVVGIVLMIFAFAIYLYPYFITEMTKSFEIAHYFGIASFEYLGGVFNAIPHLFDLFFSWIAFAIVKALYFVGLRPSYGDTATGFVLIRAAAGLILLPGLVRIAFVMPRRQRLFIALYCLPIFLGPTQDRYNLAIFPILFIYGGLAYDALWRAASRFVLAVLTKYRGWA